MGRLERLKGERNGLYRSISLLKTGRYEDNDKVAGGWRISDQNSLPPAGNTCYMRRPASDVGAEISEAVELLKLEKRLAEIDEEIESWTA